MSIMSFENHVIFVRQKLVKQGESWQQEAMLDTKAFDLSSSQYQKVLKTVAQNTPLTRCL